MTSTELLCSILVALCSGIISGWIVSRTYERRADKRYLLNEEIRKKDQILFRFTDEVQSIYRHNFNILTELNYFLYLLDRHGEVPDFHKKKFRYLLNNKPSSTTFIYLKEDDKVVIEEMYTFYQECRKLCELESLTQPDVFKLTLKLSRIYLNFRPTLEEEKL